MDWWALFGGFHMKDRLQKLMVAAWEFAKEVIKTNPGREMREWKYLYNLRQSLCDELEQNTADYKLMRTITNAVLDWYEDCSKEGKKNG